MKDDLPGVYILTHKPTGVFYIGSSGSMKKRVWHHLFHLKRGNHYSKKIQDVFTNESDMDVFYYITTDREEAYVEENRYLEQRINDPLCSNVLTNPKSREGVPHLQETREKIRNSQIGKVIPQETRDKIRATLKGRPVPKEQVAKHQATRKLRPRTEREIAVTLKMQEANKRAVVVNGVHYDSVSSCGLALNTSMTTVYCRIRSPSERFKDWKWA